MFTLGHSKWSLGFLVKVSRQRATLRGVLHLPHLSKSRKESIEAYKNRIIDLHGWICKLPLRYYVAPVLSVLPILGGTVFFLLAH